MMLHFDLLTARLPESWGNVAQGKTWEQEGLERRGKVSLSLSPPPWQIPPFHEDPAGNGERENRSVAA